MDAPVSQPRHTLLPILGRSRAVLVGCPDDAIRSHGVQPTALAARLAKTLVRADLGMAFDGASVEVLTDEGKPGTSSAETGCPQSHPTSAACAR